MESVPEVGEGRRATDGVLHHPPVPQSVEDLSARPLIVSANALSWRARTAVAEAAVAPADQRAGGAGGELLEVGWGSGATLDLHSCIYPISKLCQSSILIRDSFRDWRTASTPLPDRERGPQLACHPQGAVTRNSHLLNTHRYQSMRVALLHMAFRVLSL